MSTTTPANTVDDEAFAAYQRVTKGMKPPKATRSPDPDYPVIPVDAEPRGVVVMLIGIDAKGHVGRSTYCVPPMTPFSKVPSPPSKRGGSLLRKKTARPCRCR